MAKRGKKRLPNGMKVVDGSGRPNADTRGKHEKGSIPDAPEQLVGHALDFYNEVRPILEDMGVGTEGDRWTLESMAVLYGQARDAEDHMEMHGSYLFHEKKGTWIKNPALVTSQQNRDKLRLWFNEVGLTPSARASLAKREDGDGDNLFREFAG